MTGAARLVKLVLPAVDHAMARRLVGVLEEAAWPSPLAVTAFEIGANPATGGTSYGAAAGGTLTASPDGTSVRSANAAHIVEGYFANAADADQALSMLGECGEAATAWATLVDVPQLDWVRLSQEALPPVEAGRFLVHGSHDRARAGGRLWSIEIDAGEAFGTAHHATTLGCLLEIDRLARARRRAPASVLDLGCGSGVLAIAAAHAWPRARVIASDIDTEAVRVAAANARINGVERRIQIVQARGVAEQRLHRASPFDLVLANILANPLIALAPSIARATRSGGLAVLSGLLVPQETEVTAAWRVCGFTLRRVVRLAGWSILTLQRRT